MRQSVTRELYAYWNHLKGARSAPERSEIDPAQIRGALADAFIIEIDPAGAYPIRLSGTRMNALWLAEQKGRSFLDLWGRSDRGNIADLLLTVIDGVAPVVAGVEATPIGDLDKLELELLLLPLRHFGRTHSRVLGSLAPVRQPLWLGVAPAGPLKLRSFRVVQESERSKVEARHAALIEDGVFQSRASMRPQLVLYQGGKM